jgi:hypothetical protein
MRTMARQTLVLLTIRNLHDMAQTFPSFAHLPTVPQAQFISNSQTDLSTLQFGEDKPGDAFLIQTDIPSHNHIRLSLGFF